MYGEGDSDDQPKGSFEIFKAEGDVLFKHGEYRKALESYNTVCISWNASDERCNVAVCGKHLLNYASLLETRYCCVYKGRSYVTFTKNK